MDIKDFSERIGQLIGRDDLKTAIKEMSHLLKNTKKLNTLIVQSARYSDLMAKIRNGTIQFNDADITKNQIRFALLDLLREVENGASEDLAIQAEVEAVEMLPVQTVIRQSHSGSGDNVGGDKVINN